MDSLLADLRYSVRSILRRPGFSALAVLTLAIGIGVNTVAFSAANALLFHPFVFKGVERLGWIMLSTPGNPHGALSFAEFSELKQRARAFDVVAAEGRMPLALMTDGRAEQVWALLVSDGYFRALGTTPSAGRLLEPADATRNDLVAVVSHRFWKQRLNGASIAGQTITIANRTVSVVGVLPEGFQGPGGLFAPELWLPLERADALGLPRRRLTQEERWLTTIAHLGDAATAPQAQADLSGLAAQLPAPANSTDARERRLAFFPMRNGHPEVRGLAPFVWMAMGVIGVVLLIACFNVAALLLARATERRREIGIRTALGASRLRIVRQLVTEGLLLALLSGCTALVLAGWSAKLLDVFSLPAPIPQRLNMAIDGRVVSFTALIVLIAGVLPGLLPALQATRRNLVTSIRLGGAGEGRPSRVRGIFVVAQIAGSTLFLATALLFVRSFWYASAADPGFNADHLVVAQLEPALYGFEGARSQALAQQIADRLGAAPGVVVAIADRVPYAVGYPLAETVGTAGVDCSVAACKPTVFYAVGARHFEALGLPMRAGRSFSDGELRGGGAIIVNEVLAAKLWPGQPAVGQRVTLGIERAPADVVGVAGDTSLGYWGKAATPIFYRPIRETDFRNGFSLLVRTSGSEAAAAATIRDAVHALSPAVPIAALSTMREKLELPMWPRRTAAGLFLICGVLALVLAIVGLFGVTYFTVDQRTREFGIRIALGARSSDVIRQVLREGLNLAFAGAFAGLALAFVAGRLTARMLVGVSPGDPLSLITTVAIEIAVALAACALPARRATQSDPMLALRDDH